MTRAPRDRAAERATIAAAADRLLAGIPLRSSTGRLTVTELIAESGLRRDIVYGGHKDLTEAFLARAHAQTSTPGTLRELTAERDSLAASLRLARSELTTQRDEIAVLRRAIAELSLEADHAHRQKTTNSGVIRLPVRPLAAAADGCDNPDRRRPDPH